jgi:hypothetical protein
MDPPNVEAPNLRVSELNPGAMKTLDTERTSMARRAFAGRKTCKTLCSQLKFKTGFITRTNGGYT